METHCRIFYKLLFFPTQSFIPCCHFRTTLLRFPRWYCFSRFLRCSSHEPRTRQRHCLRSTLARFVLHLNDLGEVAPGALDQKKPRLCPLRVHPASAERATVSHPFAVVVYAKVMLVGIFPLPDRVFNDLVNVFMRSFDELSVRSLNAADD